MHPVYQLNDTIIAPATPAGTGAIGVIRLSGKDAIALTNSLFKGKNLQQQPSHTIHLGKITEPDGSVIDEVLVSLFIGPHSYTGENVVEISATGSPFILQKILEVMIAQGARSAEPGEFTLRAFLKKLDLSQAEAVADLIASDSRASHDMALNQMRGGFAKIIRDLREELIRFAALIELELDFSEEDVEFANREQLIKLIDSIQEVIRPLIQSFQLGNVLKTGVTTVIAGRPNAGKSTLLNALLQEDRAIVSEIAGTTRDTIEETLHIHGILFRLIDTAGIREAADAIEHLGIERTFEKIRQSSIILYVFDSTTMDESEVKKDLDMLHTHGIPVLLLGNKEDLMQDMNRYPGLDVLFISASNGLHLDILKKRLYEMVVKDTQLSGNHTIVSNLRHYESLLKANQSLDKVREGIQAHTGGELVAFDLRAALQALGTITGDIDVDKDILGTIFGKFCIGK